MLTDLEIREQVVINYSGVYSPVPAALSLAPLGQPGVPWKLNAIRTTNTSGPAIMLTSHTLLDETGLTVQLVGIVPWQFPSTTIVANTTQTPDQSIIALFTQNIGGSIAGGTRVFSNWTIQAAALNPVGGSFNADFFFSVDDERM